jgi:hypothetical protein
MAEHDVKREQRGIREGERESDRFPDEPYVCQAVNAGSGEQNCESVATTAYTHRGETDRPDEFDRGHRAER